jgi:hypothetical protein
VVTRARPAVAAAALLLALLLAGCGDTTHSQTAATSIQSSGGGAEAGPASSYAPPDSALYLRADRKQPAWPRLHHMGARLTQEFVYGNVDPLQLLAWVATGKMMEWPDPSLRAALGGDAVLFLARDPQLTRDTSHLSNTHLMSYDEVSDRGGVERWLAKSAHRDGDDGEFALYADPSRHIVAGLSDTVFLTATGMADLRGAIDRKARGARSLADDPAFRKALARDYDRDATIVGYSRGELVAELAAGIFAEPRPAEPSLTSTAGLTGVAFSAGVTDSGFWMHAHPASGPGRYDATHTFAPTLLERVPKGSYAYLGFADAGAQLAQLARIYDGFALLYGGPPPSGEPAPSDKLPAWAETRLGIGREQLQAFLHGEQAWWWGLQSGVAFRPADAPAALAAANQVSRQALYLDYGIDHLTPARDGDVVSLTGVARAGAARETITHDPAFGDLLRHARVPKRVALLFYADRRLVHVFDHPAKPGGARVQDQLSALVLWIAPVDGGYDVDVYANLENPG